MRGIRPRQIPFVIVTIGALIVSLTPNARGVDAIGQGLQQSFIWLASAPTGQQACVVFRKTFALTEAPERASLRLFADTRYILWINGRYVDRGPCRFDPVAPEYDTLDVTPYLVSGANVVALLVQHCHDGKEQTSPDAYNGRSMRHAPGLTAQLAAEFKQGEPQTLVTDASWRGNGHTRFKPGFSTWASHLDDIDARIDTADWTQPDFDDSTWETAAKVDGSQWGALRPRGIPLLRETVVEPLKLVERSGAPADQPLNDTLPLSLKAGESVIVDAGRFVQAYSVLDLDAQDGAELELEYAQAYFTTERKPVGAWDHKNHYIARAGRQTYMSTDTFGFKYLVIRVLGGELRIESLKFVNRLYPFDVAGRFTSSDKLLDAIWQLGIDTVLTCSEDSYVDCATRERVEWLGDGVVVEYPITRVAFAGPGADGKPMYADPRLLRNMIRHIGQSQQPDGRVKAHHPSDRWDIHGYIEDYACLWIQGVRTYCENVCLPNGPNDGPAVARELWPAIQGQLKWFAEHRSERGLVLARDFVFPGNPLCYRVCEGATLNAYYYKALADAAWLATVLGENARCDEYAAAALAVKDAFNKNLWDEASGSYFGGIENGAKVSPTAHAALTALYFDVVPADRIERVRQWLLAHYEQEGISSYIHMLFLKVLYDMNTDAADQLALDLIRHRWRAMAEGESKTAWESFGPGEYCHDMGSAPPYFLSRYVLGVRVDGPVAERSIRIQPRLGDLERASGVVVTEFGPVAVSWNRSEGALAFEVDVPEGVEARISLPCASDAARLQVDGVDAADSVDRAQRRPQREGRFLTFALKPGKHSGSIDQSP